MIYKLLFNFLDRIQIRVLDPLLEFFSLGEHRDTVKSFDMKLEDSLASVLRYGFGRFRCLCKMLPVRRIPRDQCLCC